MRTLQCCLLFFFVLVGLGSAAQSLYFPPTDGSTWETTDPLELNWCPEKIDSLYAFLNEQETRGFAVLKDGKIVLEQYFEEHTADSLWVWFSAGKSLRALLLGIAHAEGELDVNNQTSAYLGSGWTSLTPEQENRITVWHQITMTTGLNENEFFCITPECLTYLEPAGTRWAYHNGPYSLTKDVLEAATGMNHNLYTFLKVLNPIGMTGVWIQVQNNNFFFSTTRDMARFGLLIQNNGVWDGNTILADGEYMQQMISPTQLLNRAYGYLWWLNGQESFIPPGFTESFPGWIAPDAPEVLFTAAGAEGQYISISPETGLVMVRQGLGAGNDLTGMGLLNDIWKRILDLECQSVHILESETTKFRVYPNPVEDDLRIEGSMSISSIQIFDFTGRMVLEDFWLDTAIDVSLLSGGTYLVRAIYRDDVQTARFVKE